MEDKEVIDMVNKECEIRNLAQKLNAISQRRRKGGKRVQKMSILWRKS